MVLSVFGSSQGDLHNQGERGSLLVWQRPHRSRLPAGYKSKPCQRQCPLGRSLLVAWCLWRITQATLKKVPIPCVLGARELGVPQAPGQSLPSSRPSCLVCVCGRAAVLKAPFVDRAQLRGEEAGVAHGARRGKGRTRAHNNRGEGPASAWERAPSSAPPKNPLICHSSLGSGASAEGSAQPSRLSETGCASKQMESLCCPWIFCWLIDGEPLCCGPNNANPKGERREQEPTRALRWWGPSRSCLCPVWYTEVIHMLRDALLLRSKRKSESKGRRKRHTQCVVATMCAHIEIEWLSSYDFGSVLCSLVVVLHKSKRATK